MRDLISIENIFTNLDLKDKDEALEFISKKANDLNICADEKLLLTKLCNRENEYSTNLGKQIAIPHIKSELINDLSIIILLNINDFSWFEEEREKVRLVISILAPYDICSKKHLKLLSNLSRKIIDENFRKKLINSYNDEDVLKLINEALKR